jgi:hypothetical protein
VTVTEALRRGIATLARRKGVLIVFYAAVTAAALLVAAPIMAVPMQSLGESAWARDMTGNLDVAWLSELGAQHGAMAVTPIVVVLAVVGAISGLVYLFLLGGALQVMATGESFFAGCARNYWRILKLALISLLFYGAVLLVYGRLGALGQKVWGEGSEATPLVHWGWFRGVVLLLLAAFVNLVFDYARMHAVAGDQRKAWRATFAGLRMVARNPGRTGGLYLLVCAIALVCFGAYLAISHTVAQTTIALVLLLFLVRQAMVAAKVWSRLLFYSAGLEMYSAIRPVPAATVAEPIEPEPAPVERPEPLVEVVLAPEVGRNAFQFVTAWNGTPECRAAAEARLPGLPGVSGLVFDPSRLTGDVAVLSRLAASDLALEDLVRKALASAGVESAVAVLEQPGDGWMRRLSVGIE